MRELRDSHLLPKAAVRRTLCKEGNPHPFVVTPSAMTLASTQAKHYLLCRECENRFSDGGEKWILANCLQADQSSFPLREKLLATDPIFRDAVRDFRVYSTVDKQDISHEKIIYFAASVFWRCSVHDWPLRGHQIRTDLGPYQEPLRRFLLGEIPFPTAMVLIVRISTMAKNLEVVTYPQLRRIETFRQHMFSMLGMYFWLLVGKVIAGTYRAICYASKPERPIVMCGDLDNMQLSSLIEIVQRGPGPRT